MRSPRLRDAGTMPDSADRNVGLAWIKSSLSYVNGNCVEVAGLTTDLILVRDSKDPRGPILQFTSAEWDAFLAGVRTGEYDRDPAQQE